MVGPSSSHTAGAVRIGRVARSVLNERPAQAEILLYGSFAKTYKGHGTDRALVGGLLGLSPDDSRIRDALQIASLERLAVRLKTTEDGDRHPNTAAIFLTGISGRTIFIEGSSVGGGNILISKINRFTVNVYCRYPTLLVEHADKPGVIGRITTILGENRINIAEMRMAREQRGANNFAVIETDQPLSPHFLKELNRQPDIVSAIVIEVNG